MKTKDTFLLSFSVESNYGYSEMHGTARYHDFPVRVSIPFAPGVSSADETLELCDEQGAAVPSSIRLMARWPDGSVRIWELWFPIAALNRRESHRFELHRARKACRARAKSRSLDQPSKFTLSACLGDGTRIRREVCFDPIQADSRQTISCSEDEKEFSLDKGPQSPVFKGALVRRTYGWYSGMELQTRLINHGPDDTIKVRGVRLEFELPGRGDSRYCIRQSCFMVGRPRLVDSATPFVVRADDRGIHVTNPAQLGEKEADYPQYERGAYLGSVDPWIGMADSEGGWALVMPDAVERFPKAWRIEGRKVTIDLHPEDSPELAWRQGMALFQRLHLVRLPAKATAVDFENEAQAWLRPPLVHLDPEIYRAAGWRIPFRYDPARFPRTEFHFRDSFNFNWTRGTFDWGDATIEWGGPAQGMRRSGRNLEYDFVAVAAKEYARTGRYQLFKLCRSAAEHTMHTDFIAFSSDPWKEGGIAAHGPDHTWGSCYPSHIWAEGLALYHQLTGDRYALHVARRVGDFFLKYIHERFEVVQGTAREMGWLLIALSAVCDLTREDRYLDGIRRVVDFNLAAGVEKFFPTGATFATGVAIIGLDRARHFHRDEDIRKFILGLLDWMMEHRRDEIGLFEYWHDSEQDYIPYIQTHLPEALNIGYRLNGDERYLRAAFRLYQIHQGGGQLTVQARYGAPECGFAAGNHISWMGCLQSFAEKGWLDSMQYPDPC